MAITLPEDPKYSPLLAGVRSKIVRAQHHFADLHERIKTALSPSPENDRKGATTYKIDEKGHSVISLRKTEPLDSNLPLIVGDCVHNLRSALDHLVYQLAILNGAGPDAASKTAFPIYLKPNVFKNVVNDKVAPFISSTALTEIEALQPYNATDPPELDPLWVLSQLDNFDKHRLLVVVAQEVRLDSFEVSTSAGQRIKQSVPDSEWHSAVEGAELLRFDFSTGSPVAVNVKIKTATTVKFANVGALWDGWIVEDVLDQTGGVVESVVDSFGKKFFSE